MHIEQISPVILNFNLQICKFHLKTENLFFCIEKHPYPALKDTHLISFCSSFMAALKTNQKRVKLYLAFNTSKKTSLNFLFEILNSLVGFMINKRWVTVVTRTRIPPTNFIQGLGDMLAPCWPDYSWISGDLLSTWHIFCW